VIDMSLAVDSETLTVAPNDVGRIVLNFTADPTPAQAISGVLVIAPAKGGNRARPLTVPVSIAPVADTPAEARFEKARVEPPNVTLIVHRRLPGFVGISGALTGGSAKSRVAGITPGAEAIPTEQRSVDVAGDTGGTGTLDVEIKGVAPDGTTSFIRVTPRTLDRHGNYEATIPLDDAAEKSPALTLKVIASDHWGWALFALFLGAGLSYWQLQKREMVRPKRILQLALTRAQARDRVGRDAAAAQGQEQPYTIDHLFPADWKDDTSSDHEALAIYRAIEGTERQEELDAQAAIVADLEARVNAWPSVCAKATALRAAISDIDQKDVAIVSASTALLDRKTTPPADEGATKAYMTELDDQVTAVREWRNADALLMDALALYRAADDPPPERNPERWRPDLAGAKTLADLERCNVVGGLCRDVHVLRTLALEQERQRARRRAVEGGAAGLDSAEATGVGAIDKVTETIDVKAAPPAVPGRAWTEQLTAEIRTLDFISLAITTSVVAAAYLVTIYHDPWGSFLDYLTAFTAGAGSAFAASWKLLPWYSSFKPPKKT
jgi:hypothetical protein